MRDLPKFTLAEYVIVDTDEFSNGPYFYYGYRKWATTTWIIVRCDKGLNTFRFATGTSDWATAWEERTTQTYDLPPTS